MDLKKLISHYFLLLLLAACSKSIQGIEPISMLMAGVTAALPMVGYVYYRLKGGVLCRFQECCDEPWLKREFSNEVVLRNILSTKVYGQHIANDFVIRNIVHHVRSSPSKPLVMSFHGGTGVGKNYMTRMIAETMFMEGIHSDFVHLIIATLHFPLKEKVPEYKMRLQEWIQGNLTECKRSLFIFDEVDKIPAGVLDAISPFVGYYGTNVNGCDPRQAIFIFLSNTGRQAIDETVYHAWESGRPRESLVLEEFQKPLQLGAFNEGHEKGLFASEIINGELIDAYVPFLPLERKHVEGCIRDQLKENNFTISPEVVKLVADDLDYFPEHDRLFSATGCKRIRERIVFHSRDFRRNENGKTPDQPKTT